MGVGGGGGEEGGCGLENLSSELQCTQFSLQGTRANVSEQAVQAYQLRPENFREASCAGLPLRACQQAVQHR